MFNTLRCCPSEAAVLFMLDLINRCSRLSSREILVGPSLSTIVPSLLRSIPFKDGVSLRNAGGVVRTIPCLLDFGETVKSSTESVLNVEMCVSTNGQFFEVQLQTRESVSLRNCCT